MLCSGDRWCLSRMEHLGMWECFKPRSPPACQVQFLTAMSNTSKNICWPATGTLLRCLIQDTPWLKPLNVKIAFCQTLAFTASPKQIIHFTHWLAFNIIHNLKAVIHHVTHIVMKVSNIFRFPTSHKYNAMTYAIWRIDLWKFKRRHIIYGYIVIILHKCIWMDWFKTFEVCIIKLKR